jgi:ribosomal protein S27E
MSLASMNVRCPRCGTAMTATDGGHTDDDDRLKGTTADCRDCETSVELYYY